MAKKTSNSKKNAYSRYKAMQTGTANKKARLEKELKKNPDNEQVKQALKTVGGWGRKKPTKSEWSKTTRSTAKLMKEVYGKCDNRIFSPNKETRDAGFAALSVTVQKEANKPKLKEFYSIASRASHNA
jgi:preprotein translocase subunit Sss1